MTRKDYLALSGALRAVRESYGPGFNSDLFRACDDHAKAIAETIARESRASFDKVKFLRDAGVQSVVEPCEATRFTTDDAPCKLPKGHAGSHDY